MAFFTRNGLATQKNQLEKEKIRFANIDEIC